MQRNFIDESDAPDAQKRIEHQKLNALLGLCEAASCRRKIMLEYFGDTGGAVRQLRHLPDAAGDLRRHRRGAEGALVLLPHGAALRRRLLIDVLLGKADERMQRFGHDKISTFGIGREHEKSEWQSIFRQLVAMNLLDDGRSRVRRAEDHAAGASLSSSRRRRCVCANGNVRQK